MHNVCRFLFISFFLLLNAYLYFLSPVPHGPLNLQKGATYYDLDDDLDDDEVIYWVEKVEKDRKNTINNHPQQGECISSC